MPTNPKTDRQKPANDGGPAFPATWDEPHMVGERYVPQARAGMSLRDAFAASERTQLPQAEGELWDHYAKRLACWRYICADAMLAEREKNDV